MPFADLSESFTSNDTRGTKVVTLRDRIGEGLKLVLGGPVIMTELKIKVRTRERISATGDLDEI